ncbi:ArgE/DapE family deacylase [Secundilactobacillus folii]|uniref:Probable succinyl-diaminopimelate desuccinylase n=1 Tax=Secundilactobacillus folii TaxID=2678357 RepID=A0A7X2XXH2_9LACO|nr:ArgE/DapE family deacylase [Secundilactobacillus folii]MTV82738.1 ArgE/DapE family deacylase [Secundilactobacillus folii]
MSEEDNERIKVLQDLIKIHTPNGNEIEVSKYIGALFDKYGISYKIDEFEKGRSNLIAEIGEKKTDDVLVLTGHQDTVTVPNADDWSHDPFGAEIVDDKLYGRGAADMKSGLAAQILTFIELVKEGYKIPGTLRFIVTAGEELGTPGANHLNEQHAAKDVDAMIVGEATDGNVVFAHSGSFNYQIKSKGKSTHSSTPQLGINALDGLNEYYNREKHIFDGAPIDDYLGKVVHSVTLINGGDQVNIIPEYGELFGNIRPTLAFDNQHVIDTIQKTVDDINANSNYDLTFNVLHSWHPVETSKTSRLVKAAKQAADKDYEDREVKLITYNGATDASVFTKDNPNIDVVVLGPDNANVVHQTNEFTTISSYLETLKTYKDTVKNYFN